MIAAAVNLSPVNLLFRGGVLGSANQLADTAHNVPGIPLQSNHLSTVTAVLRVRLPDSFQTFRRPCAGTVAAVQPAAALAAQGRTRAGLAATVLRAAAWGFQETRVLPALQFACSCAPEASFQLVQSLTSPA